jgi:apolipoprotein D and lipocalin family protein
MKYTNLILIFIIAMGCSAQDKNKRNTIPQLNVGKYMGTWYEIARYPHRFEKDLVGVTANYTLLPNGKIKVVNSGYKHTLNGQFSSAEAIAKQTNPKTPGKLKVFFIPLFGASYWILDIEKENYDWAIVGSKSMNYLWILSRTPQMDEAVFENLLKKIKEWDYNTEKLIRVKQPLMEN